MPVVTIQQGPQSTQRKRELIQRISEAFTEVYGLPVESVQVWIHEVPPDSWGKAGLLSADR